jgi:flagellar basal body-associated protein FliL
LLDSWEITKEESAVKKHGFLLIFIIAPVILMLFVTGPQLGTFGAKAHAKESHAESKIISDTLAAHKVTCLSRDGSIMTVLLDGKWVDVREVELVDRTLILRTNAGTLSFATVMNK